MSNNGIPPINDWQEDIYPVVYDESAEASYYVKTGNKVEIPGGGSSYLVYTGLLTQVGTGVPTVSILENTLGGTVVLSREGVGVYHLTLAGAFVDGRTFFPNFVLEGDAYMPIGFTTLFDYGYTLFWTDVNTVSIYSFAANFTPAELSDIIGENGRLCIEIRVYP